MQKGGLMKTQNPMRRSKTTKEISINRNQRAFDLQKILSDCQIH
jgi:hypothetical protein